jgi:hypothetical protein
MSGIIDSSEEKDFKYVMGKVICNLLLQGKINPLNSTEQFYILEAYRTKKNNAQRKAGFP